MLKSHSYPFGCLMVSCALLLLGTTITPTSAFVAVRHQPTFGKTSTSSSSALSFTDEEESEWYTPPPPKPVVKKEVVLAETIINSPEDLQSFLQDQEDGRLAIVTYHGALCRSCKRYNLYLNKLKSEYADVLSDDSDNDSPCVTRPGKVRFASVEWSANTILCRDQCITLLPTTRLYYRSQLVKEFTRGTPQITRVQDAIKYYVSKQLKDATKAQQQNLEQTLVEGKELVSRVLAETTTTTS